MNRKGFMMAEVVVVSAIVMIAITGLYTSYNKIYSIYNTRVNYYDSDTLYRLAYYRDFIIENTTNGQKIINYYIDSIKNGTDKYKKIEFCDIDTKDNCTQIDNNSIKADNANTESVYLIYNPNNNLKTFNDTNTNINPTFKDYINFLSTSVNFDADFLMTIEICEKENDCKYSYLEVYSEK